MRIPIGDQTRHFCSRAWINPVSEYGAYLGKKSLIYKSSHPSEVLEAIVSYFKVLDGSTEQRYFQPGSLPHGTVTKLPFLSAALTVIFHRMSCEKDCGIALSGKKVWSFFKSDHSLDFISKLKLQILV